MKNECIYCQQMKECQIFHSFFVCNDCFSIFSCVIAIYEFNQRNPEYVHTDIEKFKLYDIHELVKAYKELLKR